MKWWRWTILMLTTLCLACSGDDLDKEEPRMPETEKNENTSSGGSSGTGGSSENSGSSNDTSTDSITGSEGTSENIPPVINIDVSVVKTTLCNPDADATAIDTYNRLLSLYGTKILAGLKENSITNTSGCDEVHSSTGKFPAVVCYDFADIYTADFSDLSHLIAQHDAGSLISFAWDWKVPAQENAKPETYTSDAGCGFSVRRALIQSYWEAVFIENTLDMVAEPLRALQEHDIAVLFAPLGSAQSHWWGESGAPYFRELWKLIYDRLTVKHGLNNLIWVWSTDTEGMTSEAITEWYPGDIYVDIIGVTQPNGDFIDAFVLAHDTFGGKKMLSITDCNTAPSPTGCFSKGDTWLYFIATTPSALTSAVMSDSRIGTRD